MADTVDEILRKRTRGRRNRTCPRVVKRGRHNSYRVKKPEHHSIKHLGPPTIKLRSPVLT